MLEIVPRFDYELTPKGRTHKVVFHLTVEAPSRPPEEKAQRAPLNLAMVIDRSGSMNGDKIDFVKRAAHLVVDILDARDRLAVVAYDDMVDTLIKPTPVANKDAIKQRINQLFARGTTNLSGGHQRGEELVRQALEPQQINRVLLLTDGLANMGITDTGQLEAMSRQFKDGGVATTTIGVGDDFNEELLRAMADAGGGNFFYIENPDQAPAIFQEELGELLTLVAQEITLDLTLAPGVAITGVLNDYPREELAAPDPNDGGGTFRFKLGDAYEAEQKVLVAELVLPAVHETGPFQVATAQASYRRLQPQLEQQQQQLTISKSIAEAEACEKQERAAKVLEDMALLQIAQAQRLARQQAEKGDLQACSNTLLDTFRKISAMPEMREKFADELAELENTQQQVEAGMYDAKLGKAMHSRSYAQSRRKGKYK